VLRYKVALGLIRRGDSATCQTGPWVVSRDDALPMEESQAKWVNVGSQESSLM
jgi:hypothetical protein